MSYVTQIIIVGLDCEKKIIEIDDWLNEDCHKPIKFVYPTGGEKNMFPILVGAFNYLNKENFINFLKELSWEFNTELFIKTENNEFFEQIEIYREV